MELSMTNSSPNGMNRATLGSSSKTLQSFNSKPDAFPTSSTYPTSTLTKGTLVPCPFLLDFGSLEQ